MTQEETLELETNIALLKTEIKTQKNIGIHASIIGIILIIIGFLIFNPYPIGSITLMILGLLSLFIAYKFFYKMDLNTHVLMGVEKSDYDFFKEN